MTMTMTTMTRTTRKTCKCHALAKLHGGDEGTGRPGVLIEKPEHRLKI
jgi:hypothetical protein